MDSLPLAADLSVMQPAGSASSQPSLDSLSSSDGFLFSDDDSGVFVSEEGGATPGARVGHGSDSPASRWSQDGFGEVSDPARSEATAPSTLPPPASSRSSSGPGQGTEERGGRTRRENAGATRGDALFAQKCLELQGFVRPLLDLLNGLKRGRFDRGLSSFQQSVAMDRIQRIVGVLQKPHIGEKYLPTLLQVEMMLKLWFPQVTLRPTGRAVSIDQSGQGTSSGTTPPHKHKDQLHIPVKKRRLSWSESDSSSTLPPIACLCPQVKGHEKWSQQKEEGEAEGRCGGPRPALQADQLDKTGRATSGHKAVYWSEPRLTWVHVAPIFSPPKSCPSHEGGGGAKQNGSGYILLTVPSSTSRSSPATQDSSVSSTTPFSDPAGCQNQPVDSETLNPETGRGQTPPTMTQP
ncbi:LOW QUALITY PROTEIN: circadian-associated transcriptional repressor-like [Electrophorus electricus]|uniref:LOW QUALITY PROTEIN: circadian-associated transcriptional repressor-like n=1 Tax=Electrophorus electricus TaxID=8005 RepID=UPI0015CFD306|nr:LOW QUALITY PROTEIN: circadian-associated transcriptional repressor-like [Electrophorus electricus]